MLGKSRGQATLVLLATMLVAAACGSDKPASPSASATGSARASALGATPSGSGAPGASASGTAAPNVAGFWTAAVRALSKSGRMRLVISGAGTRELRFEPKASGAIASGGLSAVCLSGASYTVQGLISTGIPGKWACGASALVSSFRKSGQPVYAWNTRLPADTKIKERVSVTSKERWQWDYAATSKILGGAVKVTVVLDSTTGRLISGTRTDPTGTVRYTFSYTTVFAPLGLP